MKWNTKILSLRATLRGGDKISGPWLLMIREFFSTFSTSSLQMYTQNKRNFQKNVRSNENIVGPGRLRGLRKCSSTHVMTALEPTLDLWMKHIDRFLWQNVSDNVCSANDFGALPFKKVRVIFSVVLKRRRGGASGGSISSWEKKNVLIHNENWEESKKKINLYH